MGKYIGHRLVARPEADNTFWTDSTYSGDGTSPPAPRAEGTKCVPWLGCLLTRVEVLFAAQMHWSKRALATSPLTDFLFRV